jgi:hypothetical protein
MKYILVKSRHVHKDIVNIPAIFDAVKSEQIFDFDYHKKIIHNRLKDYTTMHQAAVIELYVTGLTPLLISVLNYCRLFNISLTLYHYDSSINRYVAQSVV